VGATGRWRGKMGDWWRGVRSGMRGEGQNSVAEASAAA
jgi:hypothetical protein